ncbi:hypothetical protein DEU29_13115 [Idiomarina aquatica]|uniref:Uncharacterized protein n=1 Tax=Idiomarina aquatica TaxID=1327752 RepID=A0A4R6NW84_9GAMM|nr:hypothetical protein [Idiomarina aquatica]TDP27342.1 hypothetical protein DEU29_13115 [Idiomarina aquatica]
MNHQFISNQIRELKVARSTWIWTFNRAGSRIQEINEQLRHLNDELENIKRNRSQTSSF